MSILERNKALTSGIASHKPSVGSEAGAAGLTLIALVVTIIVLLILAGVTINLTVGQNGIITRANEAKEETRAASVEERANLWKLDVETANMTGISVKTMEQILQELEDLKLLTSDEVATIKADTNNSITIGNKTISFKIEEIKNVAEETANKPMLVTGMNPIKFTEPTETVMGSVQTTTSSDSSWYDYKQNKWANSRTKDGSMWVWIPRYAYKITYNDANDKSQGGTIDVKFLIGTSDNYYDENGNIKTAQRCTSETQNVDTTADYTVHPAFTNESSINYRNGGWDKELTGIWVAKFEAGFPTGNNSAENKKSSVKYTQTDALVPNLELDGSTSWSIADARNYLDGIYGSNLPNISYPTFQPLTYSMNYINGNDEYNISRSLTESGNIYGFSSGTADSHLMKNSEWGAVAYLSHSKYGTNGKEVTINNATLNNSVTSVYAITGCTDGTTNGATAKVNKDELNSVTGNTPTATGSMYVWNQVTGTKASSTYNMTGVYDMSGGAWEREASYVANGHEDLLKWGASIAYEGAIYNSTTQEYEGGTLKTTSTKYTTVYPHDSTVDNSSQSDISTASNANYAKNILIYGDGIRETSTANVNPTSWNGDHSYFAALRSPFFVRGAVWWDNTVAGTFCFYYNDANSDYAVGFRSVVVPM